MNRMLPQNWIHVPLSEISIVQSGGTPSRGKASYWGGNIPWVKISDLKELYVSKTEEYITVEGLENSSARIFPKGTILFTIFATIGKIGILDIDAATNQAIAGITPSKDISIKFLAYALIHISNSLLEKGKGVAQKNINQSILKESLIPLAPLAEQKRIVAKLDNAFAHLDTLKAKLERIPELLKSFRQAVLTQAVTGQLTKDWRLAKDNASFGASLIEESHKLRIQLFSGSETTHKKPSEIVIEEDENIPETWCYSNPENIASSEKYSLAIGPFGSNLKVNDYQTEGVPLVFVRHIKANNFEGLDPKFVSYKKAEELRAHSVQGGDLLITKMGDPPGDCEIYPEHLPDAIITADCLKFRIWIQFYNSIFYKIAINSDFVKDQLGVITKGVAQQKISLERFREIKLPVPPREEQDEIVKRVNTLFDKASTIESKYNSIKEKVSQLPEKLLSKAFRGELVPQEAEDESATVLLERIKQVGTNNIKDTSKLKPVPNLKKNVGFDRKLIDVIQSEFGESTFSFEELQKSVTVSYNELSNELLQLVSSDNKSGELKMNFNKDLNRIEFTNNK